jgi:hypothetical protein
LLLPPLQAGTAAPDLYGVAKAANIVSVKILDDQGLGTSARVTHPSPEIWLLHLLITKPDEVTGEIMHAGINTHAYTCAWPACC